MSVRRLVCAVAVAGSTVVLTGCMPKMTIEEMKAMMPESGSWKARPRWPAWMNR